MYRRTRSMPEYETQIIDARGKILVTYLEQYSSDFVAIRCALKMCSDNESAEVWRDDDRIYVRGSVTSAVATRIWA